MECVVPYVDWVLRVVSDMGLLGVATLALAVAFVAVWRG